VGFAFQANSKTVVRGGYGIYDPQGNQGTTIRQERQFPFDLIYTLSPGALFPGNLFSQGFITLAQIQRLNLNSPFGSLKAIPPDFRNVGLRTNQHRGRQSSRCGSRSPALSVASLRESLV
jgi:hypothetical protein